MREDTGCVVVILQFAQPYHLTLVEGMCRVLEPLGLRTVIYLWGDHAAAPPPSLLRLIQHGRPAGALIVGFGESAPTLALKDLMSGLPDLPKVLVGDALPLARTGSVRCDNAAGMRLVADHVVEGCGARHVLVVRGWPRHKDSEEREESLLRELDRHGVPVPPELVVDGDFQRERGFQVAREALRRFPEVDAVVAFNDQSALGALEAVREAGRRVPDDVVVIGFDNEHAGRVSTPSLSTVDQNLVEQGESAARLLLEMVDGGPARALRSPVRLVPRESTARDGSPSASGPDDRNAALQQQVDDLDTALCLSRAFMVSSTVAEAVQQLQVSVERLALRGAYLVLGPALLHLAGGGHAAASPHQGLVVMGRKDGAAVDVSQERPFDLTHLLPPHLLLDGGSITVFPLWGGDVELGYLVCDRRRSTAAAVNDVLRVDVHRCLAAIHARARLRSHAVELERLVAQRTAELERANDQLRAMVQRDALTGLHNRAAFQQALPEQWEACAASGQQLSLLMLDVDHFKAYNDRYGHPQGDDALRAVARCLNVAVRASADLAARYGGEEFVLLLPDTAPDGALAVAGRIRELVAAAAILHESSSTSALLTVSIGVCTMTPDLHGDAQELVAAADRALYEAKRQGRDRCCVADDSPAGTAAAL